MPMHLFYVEKNVVYYFLYLWIDSAFIQFLKNFPEDLKKHTPSLYLNSNVA